MADVWETLDPSVKAWIAARMGMPMGQLALTKVSSVFSEWYHRSQAQYSTTGTFAPFNGSIVRTAGYNAAVQYNAGTARAVKIT